MERSQLRCHRGYSACPGNEPNSDLVAASENDETFLELGASNLTGCQYLALLWALSFMDCLHPDSRYCNL